MRASPSRPAGWRAGTSPGLLLALLLTAQSTDWTYIGGDAAHTRYSPVDQIDASNFESVEVAGDRRTVVAIDPETGETIWTFREPHAT